jgi:hypothetical protein
LPSAGFVIDKREPSPSVTAETAIGGDQLRLGAAHVSQRFTGR